MPIQRSVLGKRTADRDTRHLRVRLNIQGVAGGPVTDHGLLLGLADDDHANYVHLASARTITGQHSFSPASPQAPFILGTNAQSQTVPSFRADELNKSILQSGLGLSGGGLLNVNQTITLTSSSAPGAAAAILATNSSGYLRIIKLGLGIAPVAALHILNISAPQVKIEYDATNYLDISIDSSGNAAYGLLGTTPQHLFSDPIIITDTVSPQLAVKYDTTNYLTVSADVNGNATFTTVGAQASLILAPLGDIVLDPVGDDVLPLITVDINLGAINKKYRTIHAAELWVQTLVAQEVLATIGGRILVGPTTTLTEDFLATDNKVANGSFENRTGDDFDNWVETVILGGTIVAETSGVREGATAVKITRGTGDGTYVSQTQAVTPGDLIFIEIWHKNDGAAPGKWQIWDNTNSIQLRGTQTLALSTSWAFDHLTLEVPATCTEFKLFLMNTGSTGTITYYDDVSMWSATAPILEHNQADAEDVLVMEKDGKIEYMKINSIQLAAASSTGDWVETATVYDDMRATFTPGTFFSIRGSTNNDGVYEIDTSSYIGGRTRIVVLEDLTSSVGDGAIVYITADKVNGPFTYLRTERDWDNTGANNWDEGDAVFNTGQAGDGFIDLYSVQGLISGAGPTITGNVRQSTVYNDIEERWAIGNLNGLYGYAADEYGVAIGEPAGTRITIEPTSGIRFYSNNSIVGNFDLTGGFWIGNSATTSRLLFNTTNGLQMFNSSNQRVLKVGMTGEFYIGTSVTTERLNWDSTNGLRMFNASNVAILSFPTSGAAKIVGTLDVTSPGVVTAGSGNVLLDVNGISLSQGALISQGYKFHDIGNGTAIWRASASGDNLTLIMEVAAPTGATEEAELQFNASAGAANASILITTEEVSTVEYVFVSPALTVGSAPPQAGFEFSLIGDAYISKTLFINESANAKMTTGITINQGTDDDEIISLKSSDVAHGMTTSTETDTFAYFRKTSSPNGGLSLVGLTQTTTGMFITAVCTTNTTVSSTAALAPWVSQSSIKTGTTWTGLGAEDNIVVWRNNALTRMILKGDGQLYNDFSTAMTLYDDEDDVSLLRAFDLKSSALSIADQWFNKNIDKLQELGIISDVRPDGMFVSQQKITKLQIGAIWQLYNRIEELERRLLPHG